MDVDMNDFFMELSERELEEVLSLLPECEDKKFLLFIEVVRVVDYWSVMRDLLPEGKTMTVADFHIVKLGWNKAFSHLYSPLEKEGFPLMECTSNSFRFALRVLYKFGLSVLFRRVHEMYFAGLLDAELEGDKVILSTPHHATLQHMDNLEHNLLDKVNREIEDVKSGFFNGWKVGETSNPDVEIKDNGAFLFNVSKGDIKEFVRDDIDDVMESLIFPWDTGRGVMMGYGATPIVDNHFLALAGEYVSKCRDEAGLHNSVRFGAVSAADLLMIILVVSSLRMKHVRFSLLAGKMKKGISIPQSLPIWEPQSDFVNSVCDYTGMDESVIERAVDAITVKPEELSILERQTYPFFPMLIKLGNGMLLHPVAGLNNNPVVSALRIQSWRSRGAKDAVSVPREAWMREELYALFKGNRYITVQGNVKIRSFGRTITDIDAAIYDKTNGELALFQIKWQDFITNDVKQLRSRAKNFVEEVEKWTVNIKGWIDDNGLEALRNCLKIKKKYGGVRSVYLFCLSRSIARTSGFGFDLGVGELAVSNWPMFVRKRAEIGSVESVFGALFESIKDEEVLESLGGTPIPFELTLDGGEVVVFKDYFFSYEDGES